MWNSIRKDCWKDTPTIDRTYKTEKAADKRTMELRACGVRAWTEKAEEPTTAPPEVTFACYVEHALLGYQLKYRRAVSQAKAREEAVQEFLASCKPSDKVTEASLHIQVSPYRG